MNRKWLLPGFVLALIAIGTYFWMQQRTPPPPAPPLTQAAPPAVPAVQEVIDYPVAVPPEAATLPVAEKADDFLKERLTELFGAGNVEKFIKLEGFVRRAVATVDNLPSSLAPPRMWPIHLTPGRFSVDAGAEGSFIGAKNAARYGPFVAFVESVDSERAVAMYQRLYPLFQRSYEALGYPGKYFNNRLVAVIDLLLKTPEPAGHLKVELPEVRGPVELTRPWVYYRFSDPALEGLSSGQKMLLRVGPENQRRLKAKLVEIRKLITVGKTSR